jgi:hypothetical protein
MLLKFRKGTIFARIFTMKQAPYFLLTLLLALCITSASAQEIAIDKTKKYSAVAIGFWNIENLYDTLNDPFKLDEEFLPEGANAWNTPKYRTKINHLAEVISKMATDAVPDGLAALGMCEVENKAVLEDLVKDTQLARRNYKIVLIEGPDARGVDPAFIYNPKYFKLLAARAVRVPMATDSSHKTRDELFVTGELMGEKIHFIICHWPSRRGGELASEPNRVAAGKVARRIVDSLLKDDLNAKVVLMGDLNDDPIDASVRKTLRTYKDPRRVTSDEMFNAMESHYKKGIGTLAYNDGWNLFDQMIMTPALVKCNFRDYQFYVSRIFNKPFLAEDYGKFKGYPLRTFAGGAYRGGYSDHFPVFSVFLKEKAAKK